MSFSLVTFPHALKCSCSVGVFHLVSRGGLEEAGADVKLDSAHARNRSRVATEVYQLKHYFSLLCYSDRMEMKHGYGYIRPIMSFTL